MYNLIFAKYTWKRKKISMKIGHHKELTME